MSHTGSTRVSLRTVAILVGLLAAVLLGPAPKAAGRADFDVFTFAPIGVTVDQEVRMIYHNFTKDQGKVQFLLLDANGHDLFAANKIDATMMVAPGTMATRVIPFSLISGPNQRRAEVTGVVVLWQVPPQPQEASQGVEVAARSFVGPASLQLVDELTQRTLLAVGTIGPIDLVKYRPEK